MSLEYASCKAAGFVDRVALGDAWGLQGSKVCRHEPGVRLLQSGRICGSGKPWEPRGAFKKSKSRDYVANFTSKCNALTNDFAKEGFLW